MQPDERAKYRYSGGMKALFLIPPSQFNARNLPIDRVYGCNYGFDYKPAIHFLGVATYARDVLGWSAHFLDCPAEGIDAQGFSKHINSSSSVAATSRVPRFDSISVRSFSS